MSSPANANSTEVSVGTFSELIGAIDSNVTINVVANITWEYRVTLSGIVGMHIKSTRYLIAQ